MKNINKFLLAVILLNIFYTPTVNGVAVASLMASETFYFDSVDSIKWDQLSVGDKVDLGNQNLNHFENYTFVNSDTMKDLVEYDPETKTINVDTDSSNDRRTAIFEPEYQLDLNQVAFFGTRFSTDVSTGVLANRGAVSIMTRPSYNRINENSDWANSGTGENVWTLSADSNKLALKYRENGRYINTQNIPTNISFNTLSISINPENQYATLSVCKLPAGNTTYDCKNSAATNVYTLISKISDEFLNNEFMSISYSPGVDKKDSTIHIEGLSTIATVESYGEIHTKNPVIYAPLGTSLEQIHNIAEPRYNEFIDYIVTEVEREVPITDIVDDGGYNPNAVGRYQLRYNVSRGYDGGTPSTDTVTVEVYNPETMVNMTGEDAIVPIENAPTNNEQLVSVLSETAIDPQTEADLTSNIGIYSYGGFDFNNPKEGDYDITFYIRDSYGKFIYDTHTLTLVNGFDINQLTQTVMITNDSTNDMKVSAGDVLTIDVSIENTTNADLHNAKIDYLIDNNYFDLSTVTNISGDMSESNLGASGFSKEGIELRKGETFTYSYQVTAKDIFTLSTSDQNLESTTEFSIVTAYGSEARYNALFPLAITLNDNITTSLEVVDSSGNDLLSTNETVNITATFTNDSDYSIPNVEIDLKDTSSKVELGTVQVTSSLRPNIMENSQIDGHNLVIDEVKAHEVITVTTTGVTSEYFKTESPANFEASYNAFSLDQNVVYQTVDSQEMGIDLAAVSNMSVTASITDQNDQLLFPNESFEISFELENIGTIVEHDIEAVLNLDDINIATTAIDAEDVEMFFSLNGSASYEKYTVSGTTINISKLQPGEKVSVIVNLQAAPQFNADEYINDLLAIAITPEITITTPHDLAFSKKLNLALDHTGSAPTNVNVHQAVGDGDNKIDSEETFEIIADVAIDGRMPLPNLQVDFDINTNNAAVVTAVNYKVALEGKDITSDVSIYDDVVTIPNAKQGQHYKVTAEVTYGNGASNTYSSNTVTASHPYITTQSRNANIQIDTSNIKNVTFDSTIDKSEVSAGDLVHVTTEISNNGFTTENNLLLTLSGDTNNLILNQPENITISNGSYTNSKNTITINRLLPGESTILEFDVKIADQLTIDPKHGVDTKFALNLNGKLSDNTQKNINFSLSPIVNDVTIETNLSGKPLVGGEMVHTSDLVEYTYVLTNGNDINLTNGSIDFDISDQEIVSLDELKVVSSDPRFAYTIKDDKVLFDNLGQGQSVTITVVVTTKETFDQTPTIDFKTNFTSDYITKSDTYALNKDLENESSIDASANLISTSSGNMLVGKDETLTYDVHIINSGQIVLEDVVVQTKALHKNFTAKELVSITDDAGNQFTDYTTNADGAIVINKLPVYEELTLTYEVHTNDSIEYDPTLSIETMISNDLVNMDVSLPLSVDLSHLGDLEVHYTLEETSSDSDGKVDPGEINYIYVTITNTDSIVFNDVHVLDKTAGTNLDSFFEYVEIYDQDGNKFEDYTQTGDDVYIESFPGETTLTFKYKLQAKDKFTAANYVTLAVDVTANYPEEGVLTMPYAQTIPIDRANNMGLDASLKLQNANGNEKLAPGDTATATITINNTGTVDLKDVEIIPNSISNVDESTISISLLDMLNASLENNKIIVHSIPAGSSETIKISFDLDSTFNSDTELVVSGKVKSRLSSYDLSDSMPLDRSASSISSNLELLLESGDGDGKVDPSETYEMNLVITNTGKTTLDNISVEVLELDENIKSKTYIGANTAVIADGDKKIIQSLKPGQQATLRYSVQIKDLLTSDELLTLSYVINHSDIEETTVEVAKPIDRTSNTSYKTSLTVSDENLDGTADVNEPLTFSYAFENDGDRSLSNVSIDLNIQDLNLDETSLEYQVYIDEEMQTVNFNPETYTFEIPVINPGQKLTIDYVVNTTDHISPLSVLVPIYRVLNVDIGSSVRAYSLDKTVSDNVSTKIPVSKEVANISTKSYITTSDKDNYLTATEEYTQTIEVENTGAVATQKLLIRLSSSGQNKGTVTDITVYDKENVELQAGIDYKIVDNGLEFNNLAIEDTIRVVVSYKAPSSLYSGEYVTHKAVVVPSYNNSQTVSNTLYADLSAREINYSLNHILENDLEAVIGNEDKMLFTIDNVGTINERNVVIDLQEKTTDFIFDPSTLHIEKNGKAYNDYELNLDAMNVVLDEVNSGDKIVITSNVVIDADMDAQNQPVLDYYPLSVIIDAIYEDGTDEPTEFSLQIPKTTLSQINTKLKIDENVLQDGAISADEQIKATLTVKNSKFLRQEHATITINPDEDVYEPGTLQVISVTDALGNDIDSSKYTVIDNTINVHDFRFNEEWDITYKYRAKSVIDFHEPVTTELLEVLDEVKVNDDANQQTTVSATMKLSSLASKFNITGFATDENNNGKLAPGEKVITTYQIENTGSYTEYLVPIELESGIKNITGGQISDDQITITRDGNSRADVDYIYDPRTATVTIKQFNPGEVINIVTEYTLDPVINNQDTIHTQANVTSNLDKTKSKVLFLPTDFETVEHMNITNSLEDENQNNIIEDNEKLAYRLNLINEGNVNYMHTVVTIDLTSANVQADSQSLTVLHNGIEDEDYEISVDGNIVTIEIFDFEASENYEILVNYSFDSSKQSAKSSINTNVSANHFTNDSSVFMRTNLETLQPEVPVNNAPVISYTDLSLDEGTVLTEQQLLSQINASATDVEDGELEINYEPIDIDYQKPGSYQVLMSVTDSYGLVVNEVATVTINDKLPAITAADNAEVEVGSEEVDYITLLNISATEIVEGDLTSSVLIDDSEVKLDTTGTYPIELTVYDDEANRAVATTSVTVVRSIIDTDPITPETDGNYPPTITANDITISEEIELTDNELINLSNVLATDKEDVSLMPKITHNTIDYNKPGQYQLTFEVTDSGSKQANVTNLVKVADAKPEITAKRDSIVAAVGTKSVNYIEQFGLVATEVLTGDLTSRIVIDDSEVNLNVTGIYDLTATVIDEEDNKYILPLSINVVRSELPDVELPENSLNTQPKLVYSDVTIDEHTVLTDEELKSRIGASAFDGEDGDLTVSYDPIEVDYTTPGMYSLNISATDSAGAQVSAQVQVQVDDLLPMITNGEQIGYIELGAKNVDYVQLLAVSATEITTGDLTSEIEVDDSKVNLNVTGIYPVSLKVTDDEGNNVYAQFSVQVVRDLDNIDEIDGDGNEVEANVPPLLKATDITFSEGSELTDNQLIALANVVATDYEDGSLDVVVEHNIDFNTPGSYEITFSATDSGSKTSSIIVAVTVIDSLPKLTSIKTEIDHFVGIDQVDYKSRFGIHATEISENDLTSKIEIDDSAVDYFKTGSYPVLATVEDEEGNTSSLDLTINIIRNIITDPDIEIPTINSVEPVLTGNTNATVVEESNLTEEELLELFNISYNTGSHLEFSVAKNINYSKPGSYPIIFTNRDTVQPTNNMSISATLVVEDVLPTLSSENELVIALNDEVEDYIDELNIVASEVETGDLNDHVEIDSSRVDSQTIGSYPLYLIVTDNEGNTAQNRVNVEVVNSLSPVITAQDVVLTSEQANELSTVTDLIDITNTIARDYSGKNITELVEVTDTDNILEQTEFVNDQVFNVMFTVTNDNGRTDTQQSKITISDEEVSLVMKSNSPVVFALDDNADLEDITVRSHVRATTTINGEQTTDYLNVNNIVSSNYVPNQLGLFLVKYKYTNDIVSGTHNVLVYISEDGEMPDNVDIQISNKSNENLIMPADTYTESLVIANNSVRTKTMSTIKHGQYDENIKGVSSVQIVDSNGNEVANMGSKQRMETVLSDLEIPSGEEYTININYETNDLFTYRTELTTTYQIEFDGETRTVDVATKVDPKAINVGVDTRFDKDVYHAGENGTLYFEIVNNGTMDTKYSLLSIDKQLTNIKLGQYRVDGLIADENGQIMIPAQDSIVVEIDFKVNDNVVIGDDIISIFADLDHDFKITIPVETVTENEQIESENEQIENENEQIESENEQIESENEQVETSIDDSNSEVTKPTETLEEESEVDDKTISYKLMEILTTGKNSILFILLALLGLLLILKKTRVSKQK